MAAAGNERRAKTGLRVLILTQHYALEVCPLPNHPTRVVEAGHSGRLSDRRTIGGSAVHCPRVVTARHRTFATRLAYDGAHALDIRDLWRGSALELSEVSPRAVLSTTKWLERWVTRRSPALVTANDPLRHPSMRRRACWGEEYMLMVIGEVPRRAEVERLAESEQWVICRRVPGPHALPRGQRSHVRTAHAVLASERQSETMSAKLYNACAVGRPVIAACRGELRRVAERERIALGVPHGNLGALAAAVRRLRADAGLREHLTGRARPFAREHLRETRAERPARLLQSIAGPR